MKLELMLQDERREGKIEGKIEEKREMIHRLHSKNYSIEAMMDATELSREEIEKILKSEET